MIPGRNTSRSFAALFLFILANNIVGIIGLPSLSAILSDNHAFGSLTRLLPLYCRGCKAAFRLLDASVLPEGVNPAMGASGVVIELFSTFLRLILPLVKLFCNMLASHVVMVFAITSRCTPHLAGTSLAVLGQAGASWLKLLIVIVPSSFALVLNQAFMSLRAFIGLHFNW